MQKKLVFVLLSVGSLALASLALADDPKAAKPAPAKDKAAAPAKMELPKPPQELADMAKAMDGTWKCTGKVDIAGQMHDDMKGTITHKADLDGWWIQSSLSAGIPGMPETHSMMLTTYDAASKRWYRTTANSHGGHGTAWGTAAGNKITWEGDAHFILGDVKVRGSQETVSPKEVHIVGEYSKDGGKTWGLDHEVTCKK